MGIYYADLFLTLLPVLLHLHNIKSESGQRLTLQTMRNSTGLESVSGPEADPPQLLLPWLQHGSSLLSTLRFVTMIL